jgi:hypothetical protein
MFSPAAGAWGRSGSTVVNLDAADEDTIGEAATLAWQNAAAKAAAKKKPAARVSKKSPARPRRPRPAKVRKKTTTPSRRKKPRR